MLLFLAGASILKVKDVVQRNEVIHMYRYPMNMSKQFHKKLQAINIVLHIISGNFVQDAD